MEGSCRRRRRTECFHAGGTSSCDAATGLTNIHDLPDDLLELILLRIPCRVTLARAAAAWRPWRRLISGAAFIRRFRSLHPPLVLGHYYAGRSTSFVVSPEPPGPGDTAAVDKVLCNRVSLIDLYFLPRNDYDMRSMVLTDCRDGLLAFVRSDSSVVVCDVLAGRLREVLLPPTPAAASERFSPCLGAFFLDADDSDVAGNTVTSFSVSNFRVLCVALVSEDDGRLTARTLIFSARDSRWVLLNSTVLQPCICPYAGYVFVGRMGSSLVWSVRGGKVIHLDESTGEFSTFALLPPADDAHRGDRFVYERWNLRVVGRDGGGVRLARIVGSDLEVLRCVPVGGGGAVTVERAVNLSMEPGLSWRFLEMNEVVPAGRVVVSTAEECRWMFTVDVETMELKCRRKRDWYTRLAFAYEFPQPPPIK